MRTASFVLILMLMLLLAGCGSNETSRDDLAPVAPHWVERSADTTYAQFGIRAEPVPLSSLYWVHLEWDPNPEPDINGYLIWRCNEWSDPERRYLVADLRRDIDFFDGEDPVIWIDQSDSLMPDPSNNNTRGYYWELQAYDDAGNISAYSERAYYRLLNNPYNLAVARAGSDIYQLSWRYSFNSDVFLSYYMVRVYMAAFGPDSIVYQWREPRYGSQESISMAFSQQSGRLIPDSTYVCQLNAITVRPSTAHTDSLAGAAVSTTFRYQR
jgi:hypothetical protein